jgi:hypothetical protein
MELEKKEDRSKHWLCKHCYTASIQKIKVMVAESTASCSKHLASANNTYQPGTQPAGTAAIMDTYLEDAHLLQAERWRQDFLNWISHDDITFEQAASQWLK